MEEIVHESNSGENGDENASPLLWIALPLLSLIVVTASLYFARDILLPLASALILGIALSPIATRLERLVGRFLSVAVVVLSGVVIIGATTYFTVVQMTSVADEVAGYSENIGNKLAALQKNPPQWLEHLRYALADVERRVQKPAPGQRAEKPAQRVAISSGTLMDNVKQVAPLIAAIVQGLLVIVLLFFLLYARRDLRDRFVRLAARVRITVASQAIENAGRLVGRYLLLLTLINLAFGISIGVALAALGLPNAELWGLLAFLLRYIPYVGILVSASLPTLVAFAVFPGWSRPLEVLGAFLLLDQLAAHVVEPVMVGSGIDVSPVALLVCTVYWSWLWGIPGLLLAVPLTACLKVAGDHIPAINFLSLLLGGQRTLEDYHDFYRMLLELDQDGANGLAIRYCNENGLEETFDDILIPTVELAGIEHAEEHVSNESFQFIIDSTSGLVTNLGNRFHESRASFKVRVLGVCAPTEVHNLGLLMILELFRHAGATVRFLGENKSLDEARDVARRFSPDIVCLSCTMSECLEPSARLTSMLKQELPRLTIIAGGIAALSYPSELLRAGCSQVIVNRSQARRAIRQLATRLGRPSNPISSSGVRTDGLSRTQVL
jgi:predicted PurR-regulated permease PerM/methylmalonyl-CoA mutase cobalamin-binding subunit